MSVAALSWVLEHSDARLADRLVLLSLADHAKSDGTGAWPSIDTIARHSRVSRRAALYSLQSLEAQGAIVRTGKSRAGTVIWTVVMAVQQTLGSAVEDPSEGGADIAPADSAPVQNPADTGADSAPDPYREPSNTPPLTPPPGGTSGRRGRVRSVTADGRWDPSEPLDEVALAAYRRMGIDLLAGATRGDAEAACQGAAA